MAFSDLSFSAKPLLDLRETLLGIRVPLLGIRVPLLGTRNQTKQFNSTNTMNPVPYKDGMVNDSIVSQHHNVTVPKFTITRALHTRKSKNKVPIFWTQVKKGKRAEFRCPHVEYIPEFGQNRRCSKTCRKDKISKHIIHEFTIPAEEDKLLDIDSFMASYLKDVQDVYLSLLAQLAGSINLSGSVACQDEIHSFSTSMLKIGIIVGTLFGKGKDINPNTVIKRPTQLIFQQKLIEEGRLAFTKDINKLFSLHFVNLKTDAGTVMYQHFVHSTISSPFLLMNSIVMNVFEAAYDADQYLDYFKKMVDDIRDRLKFEVTCILHDNLIAQASAVKKLLKTSGYRTILDVPCFNHMLNLVFLNTLQVSSAMSKLVNDILQLSVILRKKESVEVIGSRAPTVPKTRWFYIIELIDYIIKHRDDILTLQSLKGEEPYIQKNFFVLHNILIPLKYSSLKYEMDDMTIDMVLPLTLCSIRYWKNNIAFFDSCANILKEILCHFIARIKNNALNIAVNAFLLTPLGRKYIRSINQHFETKSTENEATIDEDDLYSSFLSEITGRMVDDSGIRIKNKSRTESSSLPFSNDIANSSSLPELIDSSNSSSLTESNNSSNTEAIQNNKSSGNQRKGKITDYMISIDRIEKRSSVNETRNIDGNSDATIPQENNAESSGLDSVSIGIEENFPENSEEILEKGDVSSFEESKKYKKDLNSLRTLDIEKLLDIDIFGDIVRIAENELSRMSKELGFDPEIIRKQFHTWLFEQTDELPFKDSLLNNTNANDLWRAAHSYNDWKNFSTVAVRYVSCGTSEAEVERLISTHKRIINGCMTNIGFDTLEARLRLKKHDVEIHNCNLQFLNSENIGNE